MLSFFSRLYGKTLGFYSQTMRDRFFKGPHKQLKLSMSNHLASRSTPKTTSEALQKAEGLIADGNLVEALQLLKRISPSTQENSQDKKACQQLIQSIESLQVKRRP